MTALHSGTFPRDPPLTCEANEEIPMTQHVLLVLAANLAAYLFYASAIGVIRSANMALVSV